MVVKDAVTVGSRIPAKLRELMQTYIRHDTHLNESDFIRAAIREKIERDAPELMEDMFVGANTSQAPQN